MKIMFKQSVRAFLLLMSLAVPTLRAKKLRALFASASIILLIGIASPSFADSRLQAFLSLGSGGSLFQDIDFEGKSGEFDDKSGSGILFDWTVDTPDSILTGGLSRHGLSIDYYDTSEQEGEDSIEITSIFVGYRYHFLKRFYAGASIALNSEAVHSEAGLDPATANANPIAYTFGYSYGFPIGPTLGVHYMNSLPTDYEFDDPTRSDLEDLTVTTIGVTAGLRF